jgi:multisubunit Na+/H+ antiporter MnhB subunit
MTIDTVLDGGLAALAIAVGCWIIVARDSFAAAVGFVAYGLLLTLVWVRLDAIDVALMEGAIGSGLTGALLLRASSRLRRTEAAVAAERPPFILRAVAAFLSAIVAAMLAVAVLYLPDPAPTLALDAKANAGATGMGNAVTNVLMAFRGMDTMLEKVVLLVALAGVWSLTRDSLWGGRPGPLYRADPKAPLTFLAQVLPPIGIVTGIYMLWVGADAPGGAFQGGTIIAAMWLLVMMAGLTDAPPVSNRRMRLALIAGPLLFLIVGFGGLWLGSAFLAYPVAYAKPLILVIEFAMTLTVAVTLGLLIAGPPEREPTS